MLNDVNFFGCRRNLRGSIQITLEDKNINRLNYTCRHNAGSFILALMFSSVLASLTIDAFVDRDNYLLYATNASEIFARSVDGGLAYFFTNEPIWLLVNVVLSFFFDENGVVRSVIFISAFISAYLSLKTNSKFFFMLLLFLILPQVMKNYIIHLRQGLAVAIFMLGWFGSGKFSRNLLLLLTPFIHASFFFVVVIYYISLLFSLLNFSSGLRVVTFVLVGGGASFSALWLASRLGARQAEYYGESNLQISGLGFVYWLAVVSIYLLQGREFVRGNSFQIGMLVFYLAIYFYLPVSARIFESALLLVLISGLRLTSWRLALFLLFFCFYFIMQWLPRLSQPGFGWGMENYV